MSTAASAQSAGSPACLAGEARELPAASIVELILARANREPRSVALEHGEEAVTYGQLWARSSAVAATLVELGVESGARVAVWADRTPAAVVSALAAMRLGVAYVPLDPTYPADRVRLLLAAAEPSALLHGGSSSSIPAAVEAIVVDVAAIEPAELPLEPSLPGPHEAAYVVFTSGSTGTPKGVVVDHRSLLNYVWWCANLVGGAGSGAPLFASLGFDHAVTCLWVPLVQGKRVALSPGVWDQRAVFEPGEERFTFLKLTPSHARFFERLLKPDYASTTRLLMFGGEALDPALVELLADRLGDVRLVNHYGPTEATVGCCWHEFGLGELGTATSIPIGVPIWNSRAYVVDDDLRPIGAGKAGELVMAGHCVARGYLDGEAGGFVDETILGAAPGPAYRTGDVVERRDDGSLVYLGRRDTQLKISGHRVELGELRHHALAVPAVGEVAFDLVCGDVDVLEAFVVPRDAGETRPDCASAVAKALARVLPPSVAPQRVHVVDELVFDSHGKCDLGATRALLPKEEG